MVRIDWFDGPRAALAGLFALADDSALQVRRYRQLGRVLVAWEGPNVVGHLQLVPGERGDEVEVKSLAVRKDRQRTGIGRMLMERAILVCREENRSTLVVATAAADTRVLRFYQRLGFRLLRVERDVFTAQAGYPPVDIDGVPLRDRVWLSLGLQAPERSPAHARAMQLRVARHTDRLDELIRFYRDGLGLREIGGFRNHNGYDGVFLEVPGTRAHLELTTGGGHRAPVPHPESLLVLYLGDADAVRDVAARLGAAPVIPANPYWRERAITFADPDGFQVILVGEPWRA
jgi:GNAT superfamily N-acetyltransferase/catechol 2,3-dioxygenase-like lactoylglutathione lyase family enzyme